MNTVSQPTALRLKAAGWEGETHTVWVLTPGNNWVPYCKLYITPNWVRWLRAPNVTEIGEKLTKQDYEDYILCHSFGYNSAFDWLLAIMHNADELAEVWIWTRRKA